VATSLASCASTGTGEVDYAGEVHVTSPQLVALGPGVQVVADADEPLFFVGGSYWVYRDGYWFSSKDYRRHFTHVDYTAVPVELRTIAEPERYVHYRSDLGRTRHARTPQTRTRSTRPVQPVQPAQPAQPTSQAPSDRIPQPTTYPPATQRNNNLPPPTPAQTFPVPSESPDYPADPHSPNYPNVPGAEPQGSSPTQPTTPPRETAEPTTLPSESLREHVNQQDRADHGTPPVKNNPDNRQ